MTVMTAEALGFRALATTSSGDAATLGRPDGTVTRDEAVRHAARVDRVPAGRAAADAAFPTG